MSNEFNSLRKFPKSIRFKSAECDYYFFYSKPSYSALSTVPVIEVAIASSASRRKKLP
ncbi:hypothetical protein [Nostoc sp.]|uniref:hypothetical protein n=1 Tax=Nostoc sp. TaxID=1180 RepID=UPI002FF6870E